MTKAKKGDGKIKRGGTMGEDLNGFIERIETLTEEKKAIGKDISEVFEEAKTKGFKPKVMRQVIRERAMEAKDRTEFVDLLDIYRHALGMTPLEEAIDRETGEIKEPEGAAAEAKPHKPAKSNPVGFETVGDV